VCGETGFEKVALYEVVTAIILLVLRACMILVGALVEFMCVKPFIAII